MKLNSKYKKIAYITALVVCYAFGVLLARYISVPKLSLWNAEAQAYASLRKQAEKNIHNYGSIGMHALADEADIQREMQRIKDSLDK